MSESRNWADLPKEPVLLIFKKLSQDLLCILRFRAVCANWRSFAPLSNCPPQLPWLIECNYPSQDSYLEPKLQFYSLVGNNTGTIRLPEPYHGMVYYGPGHSYLLVSSLEDYIYLLNPLTCDKISLPKLDDELMIRSLVFSSSDPIHNWHLVSCRKKDSLMKGWGSVIYSADKDDWTYVEGFDNDISCNTCCWDGKIFVTEDGCSTVVFDAVSREKLYEIPPPVDEDEDSQDLYTYLVESCGQIFRVSWYFVSDEADEIEFPLFNILKLYSDGGEHFWVEVSEIGNQVFFLDLINGFSVKASAGFEGNCIYFFLDDGSTPCRYDIGTKTIERVPCPFKNSTWFVPNLG